MYVLTIHVRNGYRLHSVWYVPAQMDCKNNKNMKDKTLQPYPFAYVDSNRKKLEEEPEMFVNNSIRLSYFKAFDEALLNFSLFALSVDHKIFL